MTLTPRIRFYCCSIIGLLSATVAAQPRLFIIPEDGDPAAYPSGTTVLNLLSGDQICLEFWATGEPTEIFAVQLKIGDTLGGDAGSVTIACASVLIDATHPSFIDLDTWAAGFGAPDCCPEPTCFTRAGYINSLFVAPPASVPLPSKSKYLGELCYQASVDAFGTFASEWILPDIETAMKDETGKQSIPNVLYDGLLLNVAECFSDDDCDDTDVCTRDQCDTGTCSFQLNTYGDVDHDGDVDIFDLFCILNGFAGDFSVCPLEDVDIEPCDGNGTIDIFDLFGVLNAFSGADPCCGGLP